MATITPLQELVNLSIKDLQSELQKAEKELLRYKVGVRTKHLKEIHQIHNYKRYVAQIHTIIKEQQTAKAKKAAEKPLKSPKK